MFSTSSALESSKYSREHILSITDSYDLFQRYLGKIQLRRAFCSPLRDDSSPSFNLFRSRSGEILYKDHATGDSGDVFKFLSLYWNCSMDDVYKKIIDGITEQPIIKTIKKTSEVLYSDNVDVRIKRKYFTKIDDDYWNRYKISKQTLYKYKVNAIRYYAINGTIGRQYDNSDPLYAYKVNDHFKLYRPLTQNKYDKWKGNMTHADVFGYEQLPKTGELLIITKALKDVMVLYELGYTAIAPASEGSEIPKEIMEELQSRYSRIIIFYDNDAPGIKFAQKFSKLYKLPFVYIDPSKDVKDISDYIEKYDIDKTKTYLTKLFK